MQKRNQEILFLGMILVTIFNTIKDFFILPIK